MDVRAVAELCSPRQVGGSPQEESKLMAVDDSTMKQIIRNVFDEMLGMDTNTTDGQPIPEGDERYIASIQISGDSEETLIVEAPTTSEFSSGNNV